MEMGLAGGTVGVGTGLYTGDVTAGVTAAVVTGLARRAGAKVDERVTKRVAELLLSDDPNALKKAVTLATNSPKASAALKAIQTAIGGALRGIGTDAVRPERQPMEITVNRADAAASQ
jgi:pyridoxal biosynthesis lyase PdxS